LINDVEANVKIVNPGNDKNYQFFGGERTLTTICLDIGNKFTAKYESLNNQAEAYCKDLKNTPEF